MGSVGVFFPYFALYLREHAGLTGLQVGTILAAMPLVGVVAQPLFGQLADRSGARSRVLALVLFASAAAQLLFLRAEGFAALLATTALLAVFWTSVMPMSMSVSFAVVRGGGRHAFGLARACGTLGYLALVVSFPLFLRAFEAGEGSGAGPPGLWLLFPAAAVFAMAGAALALALPRGGAVSLRAGTGGLRELLRHPPMVRLLVYSFVVYFFVNGPIQLFPLFVQSLGGGIEDVSRMWVYMVALEIPLVAASGALLARLGSRWLLGLGILAGGVRWAGSAFADTLPVATALGLLHGVVVMGLGIGASLYVEESIPERLRSTGQALLATVGIGLGGTFSSIACGWLFDHLGARGTYLGAGVAAIVLAALVSVVLPPASRPETAPRA